MTRRSATTLMLGGLVAAAALAGCTSTAKPTVPAPPATSAPTSTPTTSAPATTAPTGTAPGPTGAPTGSGPTHAPTPAPTTSAQTAPAPPRTRRVVLAPVSTTGDVLPGYTDVAEPASSPVSDCAGYTGYRASDVLYDCGPSAALADVCFAAANPRQVLCLFNPWEHKLHRYPVTGKLGGPTSHGPLTPFALTLSNGDHCRRRVGGSWSTKPGHPDLLGAYFCDKGGAIWMTEHTPAIDTSKPAWTVRVGPQSTPELVTRTVTTAYYPTYLETRGQ